ncbi:hypothetical protein ACLOJK_038425 [Asimina triloba]
MNDLMTKSFLNYVELKKQVLKDLEAAPEVDPVGDEPTGEENLTIFFEEVGIIKIEMEVISNLLLDLQHLNEETRSSPSAKVFRGLKDRTDSNMVTILRKAKLIKGRLEALDESNTANRGLSPAYRAGSPVDRTRISVTNGLRSKLWGMMNDFQLLREKIADEHRQCLEKNHPHPNISSQEAEAKAEEERYMLSADQQAEDLDRRAEFQEREEAVKHLQRSLMELHQIFLDMAIFIETQGEHLDDIELNVGSAADYISSGTGGLACAGRMKKMSRREVQFLWGLLLMLMLVVGLISLIIISS